VGFNCEDTVHDPRMADNGEDLEGFICPICMTDFKAPNHLTKHFEEVHNDDPEILRSLKGTHAYFPSSDHCAGIRVVSMTFVT
jgi:hypothetical protein